MKTKVSPTIVGVFVLGAIALGVIVLLSFGGVHFFYEPQRFLVTFNESVQGLDLGSPVKLKGVRVGRVVDLSVRYDEGANKSVVQVVCELTGSRILDPSGNIVQITDRDSMKRLIDRGLRAHLGILGLATGLLYVELDFLDPKENPPPRTQDGKYLLMPSEPSTIAELQSKLDAIAGSLAKVDFPGIAKDIQMLAQDARKQLADLDVKSLVVQWQRTGAAIETLAEAPQLKSALDNLNTISESLKTLLAKTESQVVANGAELQETLRNAQDTMKTFNQAAQTIQAFVQSQRGLGDDVAASLRQLSDAALAVQRLSEFLERNPNALILGRKPEAAPAAK